MQYINIKKYIYKTIHVLKYLSFSDLIFDLKISYICIRVKYEYNMIIENIKLLNAIHKGIMIISSYICIAINFTLKYYLPCQVKHVTSVNIKKRFIISFREIKLMLKLQSSTKA